MSMLLPEEAFPAPPFTDEELDAYAAWADGPADQTPGIPPEMARPAKWSITDNSTAEWAMRKLAHAEANLRARRDEAAEFKRQIDDWLAGQVGPLERRRAFFEQHLTEFARWQRETNDVKTLKLPSGEVSSRKVPARPDLVKEREEEFVAWAKDHAPDLVKAKWLPVMASIKGALVFDEEGRALYPDGDGEVWHPPGVELVPEHVSYSVKPALP